MLLEAAKSLGVLLVGGSIPEREGDKVYNTCVIIGPGACIDGRVDRWLLRACLAAKSLINLNPPSLIPTR
jgi:predicted amidohydrolase